MNTILNRRRFLTSSVVGVGVSALSLAPRLLGAPPADGAAAGRARALFDGKTLQGWRARPRLSVPKDARFDSIPPEKLTAAVVKWHQEHGPQDKLKHVGRWEVVEGAIVGGHEPADSLYGAYLVSEEKFADFELELEARPDWPADTGIMIRRARVGERRIPGAGGSSSQRLHRGRVRQFAGSFLAAPFAMTGDKRPGFRVANLRSIPPEANFTR